MRKFWNWAKDETTQERTLYLNGVISEETWWGDEVTPKLFKDDLMSGSGKGQDERLRRPGQDKQAPPSFFYPKV